MKARILGLLCATGALFLGAQPVLALNHAYITMMRSGAQNHVFVSQSVEGTYGLFRGGSDTSSIDASSAGKASIPSSGSYKEVWQGYSLRTSVGIELMKFIQFSASHSSVTLKNKTNGFESMRGSQLGAESRLVFSSPIGNLEGGAGVTGARYDYEKQLEDGSYFGSGYYYLLGWNYFVTYQVSFFANAKISQEHLVRDGGSSINETFDTNLTSMGLGFSLWL